MDVSEIVFDQWVCFTIYLWFLPYQMIADAKI